MPECALPTELPPSLDETALITSRWGFGDEGQPPWTDEMLFEPGGRISGKFGPNHFAWAFEDGGFCIRTKDGAPSWRPDTIERLEGRLVLTGTGLASRERGRRNVLRALGERPAPAPEMPEEPADDRIKLVIWDLDETFWAGTLSEGGITPIPAHLDLVRELTARGIMNSVCSKNEFAGTQAELERLGIWEHFIFPRIDFAPKGTMIRDIITAAQLRAASVLFIDDNKMNLNEALHYNPGLQVAMPEAIAGLLDDRRCLGKADPAHRRLAHYKVLEKKAADQGQAGGDNLAFLRQSEIRVSFHHDIMDEFARVHDLVNRTNQLNFTKQRWPEDIEDAKAVFSAEMEKEFNSHCGYVKVADRYGGYGIVGFYLTQGGSCRHFLFSCRALNMGVEQFVWAKLNRPWIEISGEVVSTLDSAPDWITVVTDADHAADAQPAAARLKICLRGACDLSMMTHYLRARYETTEEFPFPYQGWNIHPLARAVALHDALQTQAGAALKERLTCMPPQRFDSAINFGAADVYVLSFSSEVFPALHRSRSTGLFLPFSTQAIGNKDFSTVGYEKYRAGFEGPGISEADWQFLQSEFSFHSYLDQALLAADVERIFHKLAGKLVIVLALNETIGGNAWLLERFGRINAVVIPLARAFGAQVVELNDFIRGTDDLVAPDDNGAHFRRDIYRKLAARVEAIIEAALPAEPVPADVARAAA